MVRAQRFKINYNIKLLKKFKEFIIINLKFLTPNINSNTGLVNKIYKS